MVISYITGIIRPVDGKRTRPADVKKSADAKMLADIVGSVDAKELVVTVGEKTRPANAEGLADAKRPADTEELVIIYY